MREGRKEGGLVQDFWGLDMPVICVAYRGLMRGLVFFVMI